MSRFWKPDLATGLDHIDSDHQELFTIIEGMADAASLGSADRARALIGDFLEGCAAHFAGEEELMTACGYPAERQHREAHQLYLADVRSLQAQLEARGLTAGFRLFVTTRLVDWFIRHIRLNDVPLAKAALAGQVAPPAAADPAAPATR